TATSVIRLACGLKYAAIRPTSWLSLYERSYSSASRPSIKNPMCPPLRSGCLYDGCRYIGWSRFQWRQGHFVAGKDAAIVRRTVQQFIVRSAGNQLATVQNQDVVGPPDLRQAVGNQQG